MGDPKQKADDERADRHRTDGQCDVRLSTDIDESNSFEWPIVLPEQRAAPFSLVREAASPANAARFVGDRKQIVVYTLPNYIAWGNEQLARESLKGGLDAAASLAIDVGVGRLCVVPGVKELRVARAKALPVGDPEAMYFFNNFGLLNIEAGGAGFARQKYAREVPKGLHGLCGRIAADLGLTLSLFATLAYSAAYLGEDGLVPPRYQKALYDTLCHFSDRVERRHSEAGRYLSGDDAPQATGSPTYVFDDVVRRKKRRTLGP